MNDQKSFERFLSERFDDVGPGRRMPDAVHNDLLSRVSGKRQRPQWLALIKESPMRISSGLAVGSPTARVAAIMVATLLIALTIAGAGVAGSRLLAAGGPIVVDQDGDGTVTTIAAGLAMAEDGDTILVRPGVYTEAIIIDKNITLTGDGDREEIIIAFDDGKTPVVTLTDSDATLSNLTLTGENSQVLVSGGAPTLEDLLFDGVGIPYAGGAGQTFAFSLNLVDGTRAQVIGNTFVDGGELGVRYSSAPIIEGNTFTDGPQIYLESAGDETVVKDNTIRGVKLNGIGLFSPGKYLVEGNTIIDARVGIVSPMSRAGLEAIIRDNTISGAGAAIKMPFGASPTIDGNIIRESETGIVLAGGASPSVMGNDIEVTGIGISIGPDTGGVVSGNTICGGEVSIDVDASADTSVIDNEICE